MLERTTRIVTRYVTKSIIVDCLVTPGIPTNIVKYLSTDTDIIRLYMIVNSTSLRYELQQRIDDIGNKHKKQAMITRLREFTGDKIFKASNSTERAVVIKELYDYIYSCDDDIRLLGKLCIRKLVGHTHRLMKQSIKNKKVSHMKPILAKFFVHFRSTIEWACQSKLRS